MVQLAKFDDEYHVIDETLSTIENSRFILDRTSFGEYIWTRYWNRTGKYTDYVTSSEFFERHADILSKSMYIEFYMSNIDELVRRIETSDEDLKIFTIGGRSVKENIKYVYGLYEELEDIVRSHGMDYLKIDASQFKTFEDDERFVNKLMEAEFHRILTL